jgi:glycosyltransferase involved in cell wall biosynthesis
MVANLQRHKDHATLLRAWRIVCDRLNAAGNTPLAREAGEGQGVRASEVLAASLSGRGRRAMLVLAGRLDAADPLKQMVHDLELEPVVRFLGEVDDVSGLLSAADLGVFSSRSEGCPNGVLESMGAGLAVVATDCPGIREAVGEQSLPWLAPAGDAEALADRIAFLAEDAAIRARVGQANALRIQSEFGIERMNAEIGRLLASALRDRRWP